MADAVVGSEDHLAYFAVKARLVPILLKPEKNTQTCYFTVWQWLERSTSGDTLQEADSGPSDLLHTSEESEM